MTTTMTPKIKKLRTNALVLLGSVLLLGLTLLCACRQSVGKSRHRLRTRLRLFSDSPRISAEIQSL